MADVCGREGERMFGVECALSCACTSWNVEEGGVNK